MMKTDITTKLLRAIIALVLPLNAFNPWLRPIPVAASVQGPPFFVCNGPTSNPPDGGNSLWRFLQ